MMLRMNRHNSQKAKEEKKCCVTLAKHVAIVYVEKIGTMLLSLEHVAMLINAANAD